MIIRRCGLIINQLFVTHVQTSLLVVELPVLILSEKRDPDGRQSLGLE
jgi:hypothetical protein